jgi:hypothetical protein
MTMKCPCIYHDGHGGAHPNVRCTCKGGPVNEWTAPASSPPAPAASQEEIYVEHDSVPKQKIATGDALRERFKWKKVAAPVPWKPTHNNDELVGYYGGQTLRDGQYGQYRVIIMHVPGEPAPFTVSGTRIIQLFDAALVGIGHAVRVQYLGMKDTGNGHSMKDFNVYVAEGDPISESDLPQVKQ